MPATMTDLDVLAVLPEIAEIGDTGLRATVIRLWIEVAAQMPWDCLTEVPKNFRTEASRSLILHIRGVTQMSLALCRIAHDLHGKAYDHDTTAAAALLHDLSKPLEQEPVPGKPAFGNGVRPGRKSHLGKMIQHGVYAAHMALQQGLSLELVNLIITHTHQSNTRGTTWEAAALFYADFADTDVALSDGGSPMYIQRWQVSK